MAMHFKGQSLQISKDKAYNSLTAIVICKSGVNLSLGWKFSTGIQTIPVFPAKYSGYSLLVNNSALDMFHSKCNEISSVILPKYIIQMESSQRVCNF